MPELPEVETVCRGLNRLTLGQVIQGGAVLHPSTLAYPFSVDQFWQQLQGATLEHWQRRGKYLLANLSKQGKAAGYLGLAEKVKKRKKCGLGKYGLKKHR